MQEAYNKNCVNGYAARRKLVWPYRKELLDELLKDYKTPEGDGRAPASSAWIDSGNGKHGNGGVRHDGRRRH